jgi:hypothetical protein
MPTTDNRAAALPDRYFRPTFSTRFHRSITTNDDNRKTSVREYDPAGENAVPVYDGRIAAPCRRSFFLDVRVNRPKHEIIIASMMLEGKVPQGPPTDPMSTGTSKTLLGKPAVAHLGTIPLGKTAVAPGAWPIVVPDLCTVVIPNHMPPVFNHYFDGHNLVC